MKRVLRWLFDHKLEGILRTFVTATEKLEAFQVQAAARIEETEDEIDTLNLQIAVHSVELMRAKAITANLRGLIAA